MVNQSRVLKSEVSLTFISSIDISTDSNFRLTNGKIWLCVLEYWCDNVDESNGFARSQKHRIFLVVLLLIEIDEIDFNVNQLLAIA